MMMDIASATTTGFGNNDVTNSELPYLELILQ
jgi:hypothetical protein